VSRAPLPPHPDERGPVRFQPSIADITFDEWRACYRDLDDDSQLAYNSILAGLYPDQDHAAIEPCRRFFQTVTPPVDVIELGGWTGRLAAHMLQRYPGIREWRNLETYALARYAHIPRTARYYAVDPGRFYWWRNGRTYRSDVLVAAHFLEHFPGYDVAEILTRFPAARWAYLEVPLPPGGEPADWTGYQGTHILELGWDGLGELLAGVGWQLLAVDGDARWYQR
jgi:hypothetical protein